MDFEDVMTRGLAFRLDLLDRKVAIDPAFPWYPYDTMANLLHLDTLLSEPHRGVFTKIAGGAVADIGAADGDFGFFLEQELGCAVDLIDHGPTNVNGLRGARRLADALGSSARVHDTDLDAQFSLPRQDYAAIFLLGILYHLKNPFFVLEQLARASELCLLSTRVAALTPDHQTRLADVPVAYLLDPDEANHDSTNYWIFSLTGLRRILARTGWEVLDLVTVGCTADSDPATPDHDERAFCLLRSTVHR